MSGEGKELVTGEKKHKEGGGPSSISCPMLNSANYTVWAIKMGFVLKVNKVWSVVETESDDAEKNDLASALILQSIPEALVLQVGSMKTAKKVWEAIKTRHVGAERVKDARLQTLMADFERLKMKDTERIDDFVERLTEISSNAASLGKVIEEPKIVKKFLNSLPRRKYIHMVASLEQVLDLNTVTFEEVVGRMKAYEERIREEEDTQEEQKQLMFSNQDSSSGNQYNRESTGDFRGRGRGGRGLRGRGRGRNGWRDPATVTCYRCDQIGHFASQCPDRLLKLQEAKESEEKDTEEADKLLMNEVVYLNEKNCVPSKFETSMDGDNVWYLDNGASNHMTGDHRYFNTIDYTVTGKVRFGDDSRVDIKGKGTIAFVDSYGRSRVMTEVYYIPDLRSNVISLGQATEAGCDVRLRGNYLTMYDKDGFILVKTERSKNRLYKVHMGLTNNVCLNLAKVSESSKWHDRMGHINYTTLSSMFAKEHVIGGSKKSLTKELCSSCLLGKQPTKVFPSATTFRATKKLELIHGDLCGPIAPETKAGNKYIFVLVDDYSRYMWSMLLK